MLDALVNRPNNILERQKAIQSSHLPVYYRLPRSKLYVKSYMALWSIGMVGTTLGIYTLAFGKPAAKE
ncbi:hypothetical protein BJ138DRAFT_1124801 [Hygrophoropsis aurantiaca]|uniref:Uncharacterized protein n=1 Tax=Hygrophoropsis aurantiaca TaxID=72124 RepID=A0ACB8AIE9_9AGAM|nr:hypothetical protein BJ138DRAFT_1124801 [Hygrophoropsis aurantiaca]